MSFCQASTTPFGRDRLQRRAGASRTPWPTSRSSYVLGSRKSDQRPRPARRWRTIPFVEPKGPSRDPRGMADLSSRHDGSLRSYLTERPSAMGRQPHERPITGDGTPHGDLGPRTRLLCGAPLDTTRHRTTPACRAGWGFRTLPYAFVVADQQPPAPGDELRLVLTSPSGAIWHLGTDQAPSIIRGPAGDSVSPRHPPTTPTRTIGAPVRRCTGTVLSPGGSSLPVGA